MDSKPKDIKETKDGKEHRANMGEAPIVVNWRISQWFPDIAAQQQDLLRKFHEELLKFSKSVNLISVKTIPNADVIHFADSILACQAIARTNTIDEIYDFGSGNGFPGIVMAILYPQTKVHLVELDQRKAEFLKHCIAELGLKNADVFIRDVQMLPDKSIKYAISRGFAPLAKAILNTRRQFPKGGKYFHLKGEEWANEVGAIPSQLCSYWLPSLVAEYKLPVGEVTFAVVKTEKISD